MNSKFNVGLSTDPAVYRVMLFTIQGETYWPTGNGKMGFSVRESYLLEQY
jgi:hypothetical protein